MTRANILQVLEGLRFISDRLVARQAYNLIKMLSDDSKDRLRSRVRVAVKEVENDEG